MNKLSVTMFSLVALTGIAMAQPKPQPKAGAAVGVGAKVDVKAGGAAAKVDAKAAAAALAAVAKPKPPAEIAATLKMMGARHRCTGTGLGPDFKSEVAFKGTSVHKTTLDGWFIQMSMTGTMGQGKAASKMKMESFMTYDPKSGKWRSVGAMNDGTTMAGVAEMKDGKIEGSATMWSSMGEAMFREHGDMTDPKAGFKMWGEMSMDKGKTWMKVYEMTCKK